MVIIRKEVLSVVVLFFCGAVQNAPNTKSIRWKRTVNGTEVRSSVNQTAHTAGVSFDALRNYKKLLLIKSKEEMRQIATVAIVMGALNAEEQMKQYLTELVHQWKQQFNVSTMQKNIEIMFKVEEIMERDKRAVEILTNAMDFARNSKTVLEYRAEMDRIAMEGKSQAFNIAERKFKALEAVKVSPLRGKLVADVELLGSDLEAHLSKIEEDVKHHLDSIHTTMTRKSRETVAFLMQRTTTTPKTVDAFESLEFTTTEKNAKKKNPLSLLGSKIPIGKLPFLGFNGFDLEDDEDDFLASHNLLRRQDINIDDGLKQSQEADKSESIGIDDDESGNSGGGMGGLVGLIASLSGGEEGSDVGALVGALSGVITNLFGPNGLDLPSLIATGTSLLAGLLSGDDNFGKVLGGYVGEAVDGFSGGGGAINNGLFFGNFLGAVVAQLSADPEEDDVPPKPGIFLDNFFKGFKLAQSKAGEEGDTEQEKGGFDFFGFLIHITSSIVGGLTNAILNASLGSSGGSSQGSAAASGGLSAGSSDSSNHPHPHPHPAP